MSAYIPAELQRQVRNHFRDCCAYCRTAEALTVAIFEFEHIIPRSVGGETVFQNLCLSCPTCNRYKATLSRSIRPHYPADGSFVSSPSPSVGGAFYVE